MIMFLHPLRKSNIKLIVALIPAHLFNSFYKSIKIKPLINKYKEMRITPS